MVGISDLIQTMGAIIIFSLILLTANKMILSNTLREVESEAEGIAVVLAQNIIEEAQTKAFDENTNTSSIADLPKMIPEGFSSCGPNGSETRSTFDDFDDYDGYSEEVDTKLGEDSFSINVEVSYVSSPNFNMSSGSKIVPTNFKKILVTVTSDYLRNNTREIKLSHLRQYYKTTN